jgi:hypothetical protein
MIAVIHLSPSGTASRRNLGENIRKWDHRRRTPKKQIIDPVVYLPMPTK